MSPNLPQPAASKTSAEPGSARQTLPTHALTQDELIARHQAVLDSTLDPIITIDALGTILSASRSVERVFGYTPDEVIGRNITILMPQPHREAHDGYLANYRRTGETNILGRTREFEAVRKDGTPMPIELSVSRVDVPGEALPLFTGIIHDISQRRIIEAELAQYRENLESAVVERTRELMQSLEQLRQTDRLASIGTLAAGLGHDMNNVLLPMRCRLDSAESMDLPEAARQELAIVRRLCDYLQQLSDGLHLLALDPDDSEASQATTVLDEWWGQVSVLLQKAVPKHTRFEAAIPSGLPPVAVAPHRLTQAALNLVVNAGEAIGERGLVRIWAELDPNGISVRLGVGDDGRGMSPEVQQRAFDPFFTTKTRGLGTGMGLSLVRGVAQSAGGSVFIESQPGKGTNIGLELPVVERQAGGSREIRLARLALIDARLSALIETMLRAAGFEVDHGEPNDPGEAMIWIVDPIPGSLDAAKQFLRRRAESQVIVCGVAPGAWGRLDVFSIDDVNDFEQVRSVVREAIDAYEGVLE